MDIARSLFLFILAGLAEIGGGWLVWQWLRTGGIFIVLFLLWGYWVDGWQPDRFDLLGAAIALVRVVVIMWGRNWI